MFHRIWIHDSYNHGVLLDSCETLEQIAETRVASGDLIIDDQGFIVQNPIWLFDWEKSKLDCYAMRKQDRFFNACDYELYGTDGREALLPFTSKEVKDQLKQRQEWDDECERERRRQYANSY